MIMSDKWIKSQCMDSTGMFLPEPMIEPFLDTQVRTKKVRDIQFEMWDEEPCISYGLSSYGYDVRCSDEFKIFTNINSSIVDPKNFDDRNFVSVTSNEILIPPNSFALARTVEYFRVPEDCLVVCLGKSTYARCFSGNTKVALVDGRTLTFKEMAKRYKKGERFFGYTIRNNGSLGIEELVAPRKTGKNEQLVSVSLDNGEKIKCTPDHKFMLRDGSYVEAQDLYPGISLMPLMRYEARGYEMVYCPKRGHLVGTHRLSDAWNIRNRIYKKRKNQHRHHIDHDRRNNDPRNITRMCASEHIRMHNAEKFSDPAYMEFHTRRIKEGLSEYIELNEKEWLASQRKKRVDFRHSDVYAEKRESMLAKRNKTLRSEHYRAGCRERLQKRFMEANGADIFNRRRGKEHHKYKPLKRSSIESILIRTGKISEVCKELDVSKNLLYRRFPNLLRRLSPYLDQSGARSYAYRHDLTDKKVRRSLSRTRSIAETCRELGCSKHTIRRRFQHIVTQLQQDEILPTNHKVTSVKWLKQKEDVYCVTVPETHNFALASGVFVHNCGIVVNVTPLEPGWEGHVTLEFSNTTPLPAKIYANEGVAQFLFFKGNEPCEVTYKDRQGKYQGQTGITLPKV